MSKLEQEMAAYRLRLERQQFGYMLQQATPRIWVYKSLIYVNLVVFAAMLLAGISIFWPETIDVIPWANFGPYTADGQWWRLVTCTFVHFGILHIGFNMYALKILGPLLERLYGNAAFLSLYLISGVGGSLASLVFHPATPSAGASGAIFGLIGGILGFVVVARRSIPPTVLRNLRGAGLKLAGINLALGFMIPFIDNAAHTGGLVVGFLAGLCLGRRLPPEPRRRTRRYLRAALLAAALVGAAIPIGSFVRDHRETAMIGAEVDYELGRKKQAFTRIDAAIDRMPKDADLYWVRAALHLEEGNRAAAAADLDTCEELEPNHEGARELRKKLK